MIGNDRETIARSRPGLCSAAALSFVVFRLIPAFVSLLHLNIQRIVFGQQVVNCIFGEYAAFQILRQQTGLVGFKVLPPERSIKVCRECPDILPDSFKLIRTEFGYLQGSVDTVETIFHLGNTPDSGCAFQFFKMIHG